MIVLEARDRVGGRTLNASLGHGEVVEVGGQWAGPTQDHVLALAKSLGIKTFPTYNTGKNVYLRRGKRSSFDSDGPFGPIPPDPDVGDLAQAIAKLDQMSREVPVEHPARASRAAEWDSQTFETWKLANTSTEGARFLLDVGIEAIFACEPRDVSLLFVLFYIASGGSVASPGSLERLINTPGGAEDRRFVGGSQKISVEMARRLGHRRVVLNAPVRRIRQTRDGVHAEADRIVVTARRAIVAVPPSLAAAIDYSPAMPGTREQLLQRYPQGSVIKVEAVYPTPFCAPTASRARRSATARPCG